MRVAVQAALQPPHPRRAPGSALREARKRSTTSSRTPAGRRIAAPRHAEDADGEVEDPHNRLPEADRHQPALGDVDVDEQLIDKAEREEQHELLHDAQREPAPEAVPVAARARRPLRSCARRRAAMARASEVPT